MKQHTETTSDFVPFNSSHSGPNRLLQLNTKTPQPWKQYFPMCNVEMVQLRRGTSEVNSD